MARADTPRLLLPAGAHELELVNASLGYGNYKTKRGQLYMAAPLNDKIAFDIALTGRDQ